MHRLTSPAGIHVSYEKSGSGPPLVLVHGSFSDHITNWEFARPLLETAFTVHAVARRGRGQTSATAGHSLVEEAADVAALIAALGEPVFLLGHSYGAHVALSAALLVSDRVRKLVLYEAPRSDLIDPTTLSTLDSLGYQGDWDGFANAFFSRVLLVPDANLAALRDSTQWAPIVADAKASLGDLHALNKHTLDLAPLKGLRMPVLLQIGSESPGALFVTDTLAATLPNARIEPLHGQAHEAMTTAPEPYADSVRRFFLS